MRYFNMRRPRTFNTESILPDTWTRPAEVDKLKAAWKKRRKFGRVELFAFELLPELDTLSDSVVIWDHLKAHSIDLRDYLLVAAMQVAVRWDRMGSDWENADSFCHSSVFKDGVAVIVTGLLNRTEIEGVPVLEMKVLGLNQGRPVARVPTQVPPRTAQDIDFRSPEGIFQRCDWKLTLIRKGYDVWPYAHYGVNEGEDLLDVVRDLDDEDQLPSVTLGDQLLASAEKAGHDFDQGDYAFDEHVVWGGQTYRVQGLANHAPGFAPVTQMAVKQVERVTGDVA